MATRYRDLVGPEPVQTRFSSSGADEFSAQLERAARTAQNVALNIGERVMTQRGLEEGEAAGAAGKPQPRKGFAATTPYGRAYNNAAEVTYLNRTQLDITDTADRLALENEADPVGFAEKFGGYYRGLVAAAPPEYKNRIDLLTKASLSSATTRLRMQQTAKTEAEARVSTLDALPGKAKTAVEIALQYPGGQGDALLYVAREDLKQELAASSFTAEQQATLLKQWDKDVDDQLYQQRVQPEIDRLAAVAAVDRPEAMRQLQEVLQSDRPTDERNEIAAAVVDGVAKDQQVKARLYAEEAARVSERVASGETSRALRNEVDRLDRLNVFTGAGYQSLRDAMARSARAQESAVDDRSRVYSALGGGPPLARSGPNAANDKKQLDAVFREEIAASGLKPGDQSYNQLAISVFERTQIIPESVEEYLRGSLAGGDGVRAAIAASLRRQLQEANPVAYGEGLGKQEEIIASLMDTFLQANAEPQKAYDLAHAQIKLADSRRDALARQYDAEDLQDNADSALKDLLDSDDAFDRSLWSGAPPVSPYIEDRFRAAYREGYIASGGNEKAAFNLAKGVISTAGYSMANGEPEVMAFAPEKLGIPPEEVRATVALRVAQPDVGYDGDPRKVHIREITDTRYEGGRVWGLALTDENGGETTLYDNRNKPVLIRFAETPSEYEAVTNLAQMTAIAADEAWRQAVSRQVNKRAARHDISGAED